VAVVVSVAYEPLADAQAIATFLSVSPATVRSWKHRGRLTPRGSDKRGRVLYSIEQAQALAQSAGHGGT